ncbi:1-phosphatidylinositol 4,5-bisphosphate phosphodiesterase 1 [Elsinoe australis]|uniref:1-phosphatidylinositol 4,5-bisphosphate phosphodiesterase 1 n=1 Tax=Elsinoe australis TaxID=40998 RepID=A0A2P7Z2H4_9PEZI|nr:1-phosphatidylinositol 4,5-bisphosphate phosphodiesterase 1 [Elsinoe australis]
MIQQIVKEQSRRLQLTGLAVFLLFIITLSLSFGSGSLSNTKPAAKGALQLKRDNFVAQWLDVHVGDPTNGYTLDYLCHHRNTTWHPNLIINVDDANGGIGNIRGNILDFLYFAISSGSSILLPTFAARSKSDTSSLFDHRAPFSSFFDEHHFISTIHSHCPELHIFSADTAPSLTTIHDRYTPPSMRSDLDPSSKPSASPQDFHNWLLTTQSLPLPPTSPTLINLGRTLWDGPDTLSLPPHIRRDFGSLLRLTPPVRRLAAIATYNLAQRFSLNLHPSLPYYPSAFLGAHLRTEPDAVKAGFTTAGTHANFSAQTSAYLSQAREAGLKVIYAASGDKKDLERFKRLAWDGYRVNATDKMDLLDGEEKKELEKLSWDQRALVDWEVLTRCSVLGGFVKSSFSFNIAVTRAAVGEREGRVQERRWWEVEPGKLWEREEMAWRDRWSTIWGRDEWHEKKIPRGAWP